MNNMSLVKASTMEMNTNQFMNLLKNSAKTVNIHQGKTVQAHLFKSGHQNMLSLQNQLLNVYIKCNKFRYAVKVFDEMLVRNTVTWNTLLSGFSLFGSISDMGFCYFKKMLVEKVKLDRLTFTSLFRISTQKDDVFIGTQLHCFVAKLGLCLDCFVNSALVDFYSKFGLVKEARLVFDSCLEKDLVLWNGMMSCYAFNLLAKEAFSLFGLMRLKAVKGDAFTFSNLLKSSILGYFESGKQFHTLAIKLSFDADVTVATVLVDMYAKNEEIASARKVFDGMVFKNIVSWNTMVMGYGLNDETHEAMRLTKEMLCGYIRLDELTLSSVLSSCANSSLFNETLQIHCYAKKHGLHSFMSVANSLINAYTKCGSIEMGFKFFSSIMSPNLVSYTSMIRAYGYHGLPKKSIELFEKMIINSVRPDQVCFLGVLSACSHGGRINEGIYYFNLMTKFYQIAPSSEHYTCVLDMLSRAGLLNEAYTFMTSTSCEPTSDIIGAFLGACKVHGNSKLAKWVENKVSVIEPNQSVNYTLLSNLYASDGHWVDVARVREMMRERRDYKGPGCSWIEIRGDLHTFVSGDKSHPLSLEIFSLLDVIVKLLAGEDCVSNAKHM